MSKLLKRCGALGTKLIKKFNTFTIKTRITILFFLINFGILILFSGFILLRTYFLIYGTIDRNLEIISNELIKSVNLNKNFSTDIKFIGNKYWIKIYNKDKKVIYSSTLAKKIKKIPDFFPSVVSSKKFSYDIHLKGKQYLFLSPDKYGHVEFRVYVKKFKNGYIQIAYPIEQTEESFQNLLGIVAWGIGIFVLLIGIIAYYFAYRTLSPLNEIIKKANFISEENLHIRLPVVNEDELGNLSRTLNKLFSRLEKAFAQQKEFTSNVAHELKTPLSMIKISLENLLDSSEQKVEIKKIISNIQRLQSLISKLLLLSKIDYMRGNPEVVKNFKNINVKDLIIKILEEFEDYFQSKNIKIIKKIEEDEIFIKGDKDLLEKLFFNLFLNAYNFTPHEGYVEIKLFKKEEKIVFKIKNSGMGIPEDKIDKIFERFYRVDESRSTLTGGSGLGLAICKEIVEIHNGKIIAQSKVKEFTEFTVCFRNF